MVIGSLVPIWCLNEKIRSQGPQTLATKGFTLHGNYSMVSGPYVQGPPAGAGEHQAR